MTRWCVGVDFGRQSDRTAIAALELLPSVGDDWVRPFLDVRYLHRLPVGTPYPEQCSFIAELVDGTPELRRADVIVDATGVGVAVSDSLREVMGRPFTELTITGGRVVKADGRKLSVPKKDLVSRLAVAMQQRRLRVSPGLDEADALYKELGAFSVSISESGSDSYGAKTGHDDLVLAVSYAVWKADARGQGAAFMEYARREGLIGRREIDTKSSPIFAPSPEPVVEAVPLLSDAEKLQAARDAAVRERARSW